MQRRNIMNWISAEWMRLIPLSIALLLMAGCTEKKEQVLPTVLPPEKASTEMAKAFQDPVPNPQAGNVRQVANIAEEALAGKNYQDAYGALQQLKEVGPTLTLQQDMAVRDAMRGLEAAVIQAAARGDRTAQETLRLMQSH
jgi:hypothetical protein